MTARDLIKWVDDEKLHVDFENRSTEEAVLWYAANQMAQTIVESFRVKDYAELIVNGEMLGTMSDVYDLQRWMDAEFATYSETGDIDDITEENLGQAITELKGDLRAWFERR